MWTRKVNVIVPSIVKDVKNKAEQLITLMNIILNAYAVRNVTEHTKH
jgi:hypothetical protein